MAENENDREHLMLLDYLAEITMWMNRLTKTKDMLDVAIRTRDDALLENKALSNEVSELRTGFTLDGETAMEFCCQEYKNDIRSRLEIAERERDTEHAARKVWQGCVYDICNAIDRVCPGTTTIDNLMSRPDRAVGWIADDAESTITDSEDGA